MRLADQVAQKLEMIARDAERIQALSRTQPHIFLEQKDAVAARLRKLAVDVRNDLGGTPARADRGRIEPGILFPRHGRPVRVEVRRRAV